MPLVSVVPDSAGNAPVNSSRPFSASTVPLLSVVIDTVVTSVLVGLVMVPVVVLVRVPEPMMSASPRSSSRPLLVKVVRSWRSR